MATSYFGISGSSSSLSSSRSPHLVRVRAETCVRDGDVVGDDEVGALAPQFSARVAEEVIALGGERRFHDVAWNACDDVGGSFQIDGEFGRGLLLHLVAAGRGGAVVGHGGGHNERICRARSVLDGLPHLLRCFDRHDANARRIVQGCRRFDEDDVGSTVSALLQRLRSPSSPTTCS